jgi:AraC-like DNA-binding protein
VRAATFGAAEALARTLDGGGGAQRLACGYPAANMYREFAPEVALRGRVQCTWLHRGAGQVQIVPDACVDLLWDGRALRVAGPDTRPIVQHVRGEIQGVRLKTGHAASVLGVPASALRDARVELRELLDVEHALERLQREPPTRVLQELVCVRRPVDAMIDAMVSQLRAEPAQRIARLAAKLGVSERQLNRRCTDAVGYGPKFLGRVLRMQSFVRAQLRDESLAALAVRLGFTDQAHLSHEASELHGKTPGQLRARQV